MKSKFYDKWTRLRENGSDLFEISNNNILLEVLPEDEVTLGSTGIIITEAVTHRTEGVKGITAIVLDVGKGYFDAATGEYEPLDIKPGNIVLLSEYSVQLYRQFPGFTISTETRLGLTVESECKLTYKDLPSFLKAKELLNDEEAEKDS